jgi:hypothetical protein
MIQLLCLEHSSVNLAMMGLIGRVLIRASGHGRLYRSPSAAGTLKMGAVVQYCCMIDVWVVFQVL